MIPALFNFFSRLGQHKELRSWGAALPSWRSYCCAHSASRAALLARPRTRSTASTATAFFRIGRTAIAAIANAGVRTATTSTGFAPARILNVARPYTFSNATGGWENAPDVGIKTERCASDPISAARYAVIPQPTETADCTGFSHRALRLSTMIPSAARPTDSTRCARTRRVHRGEQLPSGRTRLSLCAPTASADPRIERCKTLCEFLR
jgi:hypothetical protein